MDLVGVVGQQREPDVIGLRHGAAEAAAVDVAHLKVLKESSLPARFYRHVVSS